MTHLIRILLVDDHPVVRRGIKALLSTEPDLEVVGEAGDGEEAVQEALRLRPDVVLMDLVMPRLDGVQATRRIMEQSPGTHVLVLTSFGSDDKVFPAIKAGARGYLLKDARAGDLLGAIRRAARGQTSLDPDVARRLLRELSSEPQRAGAGEPLTPREVDVLRLVARGMPNEDIAQRLSISEATVRTHVSHILAKLGLDNRTQAALYALRSGIATLEEPGD